MGNRFAKKIDYLEKQARNVIYLDVDPSTWVKTIITQFFTDYPQLQEYPAEVKWVKKDVNSGYAIGALKILNGVIPIIITSFECKPLDIIMFKNAAVPLTNEIIQELISNNTPFKGTTKTTPKTSLKLFGDDNLQISPINRPGDLSAYTDSTSVVRDAVKVASLNQEEIANFIEIFTPLTKKALFDGFIEKIGGINYKTVNNLLQNFEKSPEILQKIATVAENVIEKLGAYNYFDGNIQFNDALNNLAIDRAMVFEDKNGNTFYKIANSKVDFVKTIRVKPEYSGKIEDVYAEEYIVKVANKQELPILEEKLEINLNDNGFFSYNGEKTPEFTVLDVNIFNKTAQFCIFPTIDGKKAYFVDQYGAYSELEKVAQLIEGVENIPNKEPQIGDFGIFEINGHCTEPFTIQKIEKIANLGYDEFVVTEKLQPKIYRKLNFDSDKVYFEKEAVYVPNNVRFYPLNKELELNKLGSLDLSLVKRQNFELVVTGKMGIEKIAQFYISKNANKIEQISENEYIIPIDSKFKIVHHENIEKYAQYLPEEKHIVYKDSAGFYHYKGTEFKKYAQLGHTIDNLELNDAKWIAIHLGATAEDVKNIIQLEKNASYEFTAKLKSPVSVEEFKNEFYKVANEIIDDTIFSQGFLLKEAAIIGDPNTIDAILSLNLMRNSNLQEYFNLIPDYERIVGELCKLLIIVRLGLTQIPEDAVKTAIESLTAVIYALRNAQVIIKPV